MILLTRKIRLTFNVVSILSLLVAGIVPSAAETGKTPEPKRVLTVAYFPMAVPVAVLGETMKRDRVLQKALAREGCRVEFRKMSKGTDALLLIRQNQLDAVMFSDMPAIEAATLDGMLIAGTVKRSYASVVARNGIVLESLRRKKIANIFGSTSHYALLQALGSARLSEKDVTLVPTEVNQMAEALANGKIDAFAAWEPVPTAALKEYPGQFNVIHRQVSLSFFLMDQKLVDEHPAVADALGSALIRSVRWMKKESNLAAASRWAIDGMREFSGSASSLSAADISRITRTDLLNVPAAPLISLAEKDSTSALGREFQFLKSIGKLPPHASNELFQKNIRPDLLQRLMAKPRYHQLSRFDYAP